MTSAMEDNSQTIDELLDKAAQFGKAEIELVKLKALDKVSDIVSEIVPRLVVIVSAAIFLLFLSLGAAIWLGGLLGNLFLGFFAVAAFYGIIALMFHLFMHKWLKKKVGDYIIREVLK
ncbi:MAG: phage holin family protein [Bacteroidales bacterium]|nr:phage holin family protein [Bacteroidales bacterium]